MEIFQSILLFVAMGALFLMMAYELVMWFKNDNTYKNHMIIYYAIREYRRHCIDHNSVALVHYEDVEAYDTTLNRLWDWGYTRILPQEKFEIIKPFIK